MRKLRVLLFSGAVAIGLLAVGLAAVALFLLLRVRIRFARDLTRLPT